MYINCLYPRCIWRYYNTCQWTKCPYNAARPWDKEEERKINEAKKKLENYYYGDSKKLDK